MNQEEEEEYDQVKSPKANPMPEEGIVGEDICIRYLLPSRIQLEMGILNHIRAMFSKYVIKDTTSNNCLIKKEDFGKIIMELKNQNLTNEENIFLNELVSDIESDTTTSVLTFVEFIICCIKFSSLTITSSSTSSSKLNNGDLGIYLPVANRNQLIRTLSCFRQNPFSINEIHKLKIIFDQLINEENNDNNEKVQMEGSISGKKMIDHLYEIIDSYSFSTQDEKHEKTILIFDKIENVGEVTTQNPVNMIDFIICFSILWKELPSINLQLLLHEESLLKGKYSLGNKANNMDNDEEYLTNNANNNENYNDLLSKAELLESSLNDLNISQSLLSECDISSSQNIINSTTSFLENDDELLNVIECIENELKIADIDDNNETELDPALPLGKEKIDVLDLCLKEEECEKSSSSPIQDDEEIIETELLEGETNLIDNEESSENQEEFLSDLSLISAERECSSPFYGVHEIEVRIEQPDGISNNTSSSTTIHKSPKSLKRKKKKRVSSSKGKKKAPPHISIEEEEALYAQEAKQLYDWWIENQKKQIYEDFLKYNQRAEQREEEKVIKQTNERNRQVNTIMGRRKKNEETLKQKHDAYKARVDEVKQFKDELEQLKKDHLKEEILRRSGVRQRIISQTHERRAHCRDEQQRLMLTHLKARRIKQQSKDLEVQKYTSKEEEAKSKRRNVLSETRLRRVKRIMDPKNRHKLLYNLEVLKEFEKVRKESKIDTIFNRSLSPPKSKKNSKKIGK